MLALGDLMNDQLQNKPGAKYRSRFVILWMIGSVAYFIAGAGLHAYNVSTVLLPIFLTDVLLRLTGGDPADNGGSTLTHVAVFISAICAGLLFAALYWPIEHFLVRKKFPNRIRAARIIAAFLFFLIVWLAFPLKEAL